MNNRTRNVYFWLGLIGIVCNAADVDFNTLTSWGLLFDSLLGILNNPVAVLSVAMALVGVFVDPTTKGLKDGKVVK